MHDVFRPIHLDKLPLRLKVSARAIVNGDLSYETTSVAFGAFVHASSVPKLLVAPVYYSIFDPSYTRVIWDDPASVAATHLRIAAVIAVMPFIQEHFNHFRLPPEAANEIYGRIWQWAMFLDDFETHISFGDALKIWVPPALEFLPMEPLLRFRLGFTQITHDLCRVPQYASVAQTQIHTSPRIFTVITRAWDELLHREAAVGNFRSADEVAYGIHAAAFLLFSNALSELTEGSAHIQALILGAGGTWDHLAEFLVRHLKQSLPGPGDTANHTHFERVHSVLVFIIHTTSNFTQQPESFYDTMARCGLIPTLTTASLRLPGMRDSPNCREPDLVSFLLTMIWTDTRTDLRLVEALRSGLLPAMLAASPDAKPDIQKALVELIPQHCAYRSVVLALRDALALIPKNEQPSMFRRLQLAKEWEFCENRIRTNLRYVELFDQKDVNWTPTRACDNTACEIVTMGPALKRCGGCHYTRYCSRNCQKADWRRGHRKECSIIRSAMQADRQILTLRDRRFLDGMLQWNLGGTRREHMSADDRAYLAEPNTALTLDTSLYAQARTGSQAERRRQPEGLRHNNQLKFLPQLDAEQYPYTQILGSRAERAGNERAQLAVVGFMQGSVLRKHWVVLRFSAPKE
ncbi:hypothetical protein HMN09_00661900 [Mycena chlorophos]|uniref:phytol kinase n=1 Tax=Mycena chlorophos TaxID=658473 RepID=A0A8H6SY57_MYCCL|nr:hypothetical protein HMN09_00661900 [Mycena chlorophos]